MILAVDPGVGGCGVALIARYAEPGRPQLRRAAWVRNEARKRAGDPAGDCVLMARAVASWARGLDIDEIVVEWPKVYTAGKAKRGADPNDLLKLSGVDVGIACLIDAPVRSILPRDWKGTLGDIDEGQYLVPMILGGDPLGSGLLSPLELEITNAGMPSAESLQHNVWDGVGVALFAVGRGITNGPSRRVIAR
jgi:hypothetical protein